MFTATQVGVTKKYSDSSIYFIITDKIYNAVFVCHILSYDIGRIFAAQSNHVLYIVIFISFDYLLWIVFLQNY